jgi:integrase/recombinase XerD
MEVARMTTHYLDGNDPLTIQIRRFLTFLEISNFSRFTVTGRLKTLHMFRTWCHDRGIQSPAEVNKKTLEQYRRYLFHKRKSDGTSLKISTQSHYLTAVRVFFTWLSKNNQVLYNPASELELPKGEIVLPRSILTPADVELVLAQPDETTSKGIRDRAILETFYSTGIRRNELAGLAVEDVQLDRSLLFVRQGKGGKERYVPIGSRALDSIDRYLHEVRPSYVRKDSPSRLFLTNRGTPIKPDALSRIVRQYLLQAGFDCNGSCHVFRHSMATSMLENGADIRYIQSILGHVSLDSTQIYTRVSIIKLKEVHSQTHPTRLKRDST